MDLFSTEELFTKTPLKFSLRKDTAQKISRMLDNGKHLTTETGLHRDFRGLQDIANTDLKKSGFDKLEVGANGAKTYEIIQQWSAKGKRNQNLITIQDLLEALKKMERVDVIETVKSKILEDCKKASGLIKWKGHQSLSSLDTTHSLTVADIEAQEQGQEGKMYDLMVLYVAEDNRFAHHFIDRMTLIGFQVLDPENDVPVGLRSNTFEADVIQRRCRNVGIICSKAFFDDVDSFRLTEIASFEAFRSQVKVFPIIYQPEIKIENIPPAIGMISKAVYNPGYYNFWEKILKSMNEQRNLNEQMKKMDFRPEQEEEPSSSSQSGVISTSHSTLTNSNGGGPESGTLVTELSATSISTGGEFHPLHRLPSSDITSSTVTQEMPDSKDELLPNSSRPKSKGMKLKVPNFLKKKSKGEKYAVPDS